MASLGFEPTFSFEADLDVMKTMRASARATNLHIKRTERARARDARDWTWGKGIEGARPHHSVRAAARTCLAKGAVESQEDMPSIVRVSKRGEKGARRKPAVAHMVHGAKLVDDKALCEVHSDLSDAETTADEGCYSLETESPKESPVFGPQDVPLELQVEHAGWPALSLAAADAPAAAEGCRLSHRDVALRFAEESLEELAAAERRRAKTAAAARATQEASVWKASWSKRRQRLLAARRALRQAKAGLAAARAHGDSPQGSAPAAASCDFEADLDVVKMARAAARHRSLYVKRSERARARDARDWTWGKGIEGARPHHSVRAAARTCLAKGAVESQEDMPSIVRVSKLGEKGARRKPAVARAV